MRRLLLTYDTSASGCLKQTGLADRVLSVQDLGLACDLRITPPTFENETDLPELCSEFSEIELWFDPLPASQLKLAKLLSLIEMNETLTTKLILVFPNRPIGSQNPRHILAQEFVRHRLTATHLEAAKRVWNAFRAATPEDFAQLIAVDLACLPHMKTAVERILGELPAPITGLGATERRLLELIARTGATWSSVGRSYLQDEPGRVFSIGEAALLVERFSNCPAKVVCGFVPEPVITQSLPRDQELKHYDAHLNCALALSSLGRALLRDQADFAAHNPIDRWWGNTHLRNENLWRWDPSSRALLPPCDPRS